MIDVHQAERVMRNFSIRDLKRGLPVPYVPNVNQLKAHRMYEKHLAKGKPLRVVCVKSRRTGFSTDTEAWGMCHILSTANANGIICAHREKTAKALYEMPKGWAENLPFALNPRPNETLVRIPHPNGMSKMGHMTAGDVAGARGLTASFLHISEAAYIDLPSFMSTVNTVSDFDPNSMIFIESTANGQSGIGETFYDFWADAEAGKSDYIALFLTWLEDPDCNLNPDLASDAPATDMERELMGAPFRATKAQIAWVRSILYSPKCKGLEDVFRQEYPWVAEVAFLVTGDPAFETAELKHARSTIRDPLAIGMLTMDGNVPRFGKARDGWHVWEWPRPDCHYYIGADAARGLKEGDFASAVVWNGTTGEQAARLEARIDPEALAERLNAAGLFWRAGLSPAKLNVELTGNLGLHTQRVLRDTYRYSNIYGWQGTRNDKPLARRHGLTSLGWETSYRSRERALISFRSDLATKRLWIRDKALVSQMERAQRTQSMSVFDYAVTKGHDDIFMAAMIGWIAVCDFPPPSIRMTSVKPQEESEPDKFRKWIETDEADILPWVHLAKNHQRILRDKHRQARMTGAA